MIKHLDLFSGIGGFALAVDWTWKKAEHIFCEVDSFCQQVLKEHWPNSKIYGDIKKFKTNNLGGIDLLTGGFPCQPFSVAGKRRAESDDRHLWPEMFRIIKECRPSWIIGENVTGIIELALEQVCFDLESEGYEVWPVVVPACAVNAPHRRDRVWIIAHHRSTGLEEKGAEQQAERSGRGDLPKNDSNATSKGRQGRREKDTGRLRQYGRNGEQERRDWDKNWLEVATRLCSMDDGLPAEVGELKLSKSRHRAEQLKAYGNAIVPQVAYEIIKYIV